MMDEPHPDETQPEKAKTGAPPAGTAGVDNTGMPTPHVEGGQPAVGGETIPESREAST